MSVIYEIQKWTRETFPDQTTSSVLDHMVEEFRELRTAIVDNENMGEEIADLIILLIALGETRSLDIDHHLSQKFEVNKKRLWYYDEKLGYHKHLKDPTP